jgi:hypothetical protein
LVLITVSCLKTEGSSTKETMSISSPQARLPRESSLINAHKKPSIPLPPNIRFKGNDSQPPNEALESDPLIQAETRRLIEAHPKGLFGRVVEVPESVFQSRARFNLTQDPAALHGLLPYRKRMADSQDTSGLKQYDALVSTILNKAEFYDTPAIKPLRDKLRPLYHQQRERSVLYPLISFFKKLYLIIRKWVTSNNSFRQYRLERARDIHKRADNIDNTQLKEVIQHHTSPLKDKSTRYFIAAGIAELLHQHPEYADMVLNPKHNRPLRFVVSHEPSQWVMAGQMNMGANVIWIYHPALWFKAHKQNTHVAQHEFVHALSESAGLDQLPMMDEQQKRQFIELREKLFQHFYTQDNTWAGHFRTAKNDGIPSAGIPPYGFSNNIEFLAVSLDTFKANPKALCQTPDGKELYGLYRKILGIDPLNDIPKKSKPE